MSKVKQDLLKQIEASVARKNKLVKEMSREKTISNWVSEFFTEYEKIKRDDHLTCLALNQLTNRLRTLDRKCYVAIKAPDDGSPTVEIMWSSRYIQDNNCEEVTVLDASAAFFQEAMEQME